ncbi:TolC family protein [Dysgonomonas sp. 520]|uniref:TolC family protein n=1 Tax=Dysgonomonas sp. 520 TaxID=2302931 RepID=UPI0013D11BC3|nr:TolC family protein [Dysgonomonas sp. 520]NDW10905.1 TolC family protein [Dysgonomonas sp. 520]
MKKYIITGCFLLAAILVQAQTKWTLRQCIDYAIENNIEIKQQDLTVKNSEIELSTSKNSRLPDLSASVNQEFNFGNAYSEASKSYVSSNSSGTSFNVSSNTPIFTGFKIPNEVKAKELNLSAAIEGLKRVKDDIALQVTSYYLDVLFKKEILRVYEEQASLTQKQVEQTSILVESGKVARSQLFDIKSQLAGDELNVVNSKNDLDLSLLNLAQALNLQDNSNFDIEVPVVADVIENNLASVLPVDQIYRTAINVKPQVKEAEYNIESSKKSLKVAQAGYYPTLNLNLGYSTRSLHVNGMNNESFFDQLNHNSGEYIGLTLSIPIFNRFQTRNQVRAARLKIQNNELSLDNTKLALFKEIQQAYQSAVAAQAKYDSSEKSLDAAAESFKYAKEKYEVGKSTVYEYDQAQTKLISSKSGLIQAKYDFLFRAKILDFYMGKEITLD